MPDWLFITLAFGTGPAMAVGLLVLYRWRKHRDDLEAWDRGQALRRQILEQQAERTHGVGALDGGTFSREVQVKGSEPREGKEGEAT